jgi:hypothetical protein
MIDDEDDTDRRDASDASGRRDYDYDGEGRDKRVSAGRREYDDANAALDAHIKANDERLRRFFIGGLIAFGIIGLACTVALIGFGITLNEIKDTRTDFVRSNCESQNEQHDNTYKTLQAAAAHDIAQAEKGGSTSQGKVTVAEIQSRRDVTLGLIDALRPKQDCDYLVKLSNGEISVTPVATLAAPTPTPGG